jgi:hypothetical protein
MAARKKTRRKRATRKTAPRKRKAAKARPGELVMQVAGQMAAVIERGLKRTLAKLPRRGASAAAKEKLKTAITALRRQAESLRQQAQDLEARGAEAAASVWRPLGDRLDKAAAELRQRLAR